MPRLSRTPSLLCLLALGLALGAVVPVLPTASAATSARPKASLDIVQKHYVGGQAVTYVGNIGRRGKRRRIHLQMNMFGNDWNNLEGNRHWRTRRDGSFRFRYQALSMFNNHVRVKARGAATPAVTVKALSQDLVLDAPSQVAVGDSFRIGVDTTPALYKYPDFKGLPVFEGRVLTLQQRVDGYRWVDVDGATDTVDSNGNGSFEVDTTNAPGSHVYRVVQEDWDKGPNQIGWYPSHPVFVQVGGSPQPSSDHNHTTWTRQLAKGNSSRTASQAFRWAAARYDFAWEFGESLTSKPYRGRDKRLRGWWLDASDGGGRAAKYNGGLRLDSQRYYDDAHAQSTGPNGLHDFGTTAVTLRRRPIEYGRWEVRMRLQQTEFDTAAGNYHAKIELLPAAQSDFDDCAAITVADVELGRERVRIGARSRKNNRQWTASRAYKSPGGQHALAVEVGRDHVSWFIDGRVVGTVRSRAAVPDVPLTLRLRLVGDDGQVEMNKARLQSDWQRGFDLENRRGGHQVRSGDRLKRGTQTGNC